MSKTLFLTTTSILVFLASFGQSKRVYYSSDLKKTTEDSCSYYRDIIIQDSLFMVNEYSNKGKKLMKGQYTSLDPEIEHGHFIFFDNDGNKKIEGDFEDGKMINKWIYYDKNGEIDKKLNYTKKVKTDKNLDQKELEKYIMTNMPIIEDSPLFQGGVQESLMKYIYSNFCLPPIVEKYGLSGRTYIQFIVDKKGNMVNLSFPIVVHEHVNCEIERIIANAPKWRPGMNKGEYIDVPFTIPIEINR